MSNSNTTSTEIKRAFAEADIASSSRRTSLPDLMAKVLGGVKGHQEVKSSSVSRLEVIRKEEAGVLAGCGQTAKLVEGGGRVRIYVTPPPPERRSDYLESRFDEDEVERDAEEPVENNSVQVEHEAGMGARRDHSDSGLGEELGLGKKEVRELNSGSAGEMDSH